MKEGRYFIAIAGIVILAGLAAVRHRTMDGMLPQLWPDAACSRSLGRRFDVMVTPNAVDPIFRGVDSFDAEGDRLVVPGRYRSSGPCLIRDVWNDGVRWPMIPKVVKFLLPILLPRPCFWESENP